MPEYIEREAFRQLLVDRQITTNFFDNTKRNEDGCIIDLLDKISAADVAPVVRCKDCAKFNQNGKYYNGTPFGYCYHWYYEPGLSPNEVDGDDFCSYGEQKEGAE